MDHAPLVTEEIDEGERLIREFDKIRSVKAAFWLKENEDDLRYLYIASDEIEDSSLPGYQAVSNLHRTLGLRWLKLYRIKLIGGDNPLAVAAEELLTKYSVGLPTWLNGSYFAKRYVQELYLYPIHAASAPS
ncbi:MAG: hypothetical protein QM811_24635 [Pirellulales bacterium]